jgi:Domain of unknown function (DUF4832)/Domain of unknown function (DUF4874)
VNNLDVGFIQSGYAAGRRLVFARVPLDNYRTIDFPDTWLKSLNASFTAVRAAGMKVSLVFSYDFNPSGIDATAAQIKRHTEQLKPILEANADVIPYMRAGFIGAWGEWHSSQSGNSCGYGSPASVSCTTADANRIIIRDALLANMPVTTQIGFRNPPDLHKWYPATSPPSRAGVHNDCFLAGPTDTGTYPSEADRVYTRALTENVAFGGETCEDTTTELRTACSDILSEGAQYHLAWLNIDYAPKFINAWKANGCFDEVSRSMGYRLQLDSLNHAAQATRGDVVALAVDLRNVGWARIFSARKLVATLKHKTTGASITASAGNLQSLPPQANASTRVTINLTIPAAAQTGDYDVHLSAPDVFSTTATDPRFAVRFANADNASLKQNWDASTALFKTGTSLAVQ